MDSIEYLESIDLANDQIILVLKKKPSYPEYQKLPWYMAVCEDKAITMKLKKDKKLVRVEKTRLRETLELALLEIKKLRRWRRENPAATGLEKYIQAHLA